MASAPAADEDGAKRALTSEEAAAAPAPKKQRPTTGTTTTKKAAAALAIDDIDILQVPRIALPGKNVENKFGWGGVFKAEEGKKSGYIVQFMADEDIIIGAIKRNEAKGHSTDAYVRAGPRTHLHFEPKGLNAAIVTCGGLCPGLNNVIRETVLSLKNLYGIHNVYGVRGGFHGFAEGAPAPMMLNAANVSTIHHQGGTVIGSSRGGFDEGVILSWLLRHQVSMLFIVGGDGTHRAALKLHQNCVERELNISIVGVPKTIDNDIALIDRSFGFNTAVEEACRAVRAAKVEAACAPNGIGIVKLMGRSAGFIAAHAALSSSDVDLCLIPEVPIEIAGPANCLEHLKATVLRKGHAVVVVAEGAGEELLGTCAETDAGGNKKLPPIGAFMKQRVLEYFKKHGMAATVKYIDPSYMIRSVPANAADALFCLLLAQNAVHAAMAGYTGVSVGLCNNRVVLLPMTKLIEESPRCMDAYGRTWERVLSMSGQPNTAVKEVSGTSTGKTVF